MPTIRARSLVFPCRVLAIAAFAAFLGSCASTEGEPGDITPNNTKSCTPDTSCLTLSAESPVAIGDIGSATARLRDASGAPLSAQEICFVFDAPGPRILEPTDGCGHSSSEGIVSARFVSDVGGSFELFAFAHAAGLDDQETVVFAGGDPCTVDGDCSGTSFCGAGGTCGYDPGICIERQPAGSCCTRGGQCVSGLCTGGTCSF